MTRLRAAFFVVFLSLTAYGNSLGNGFAYDDDGIITQNPVVVTGDWGAALGGSWWPDPLDGTGLYRPLTLVSLVAEWQLFHGDPLGFHLLNVVFHTLASLLVFALLLALGSIPGALAGGVLFAIHPVHTEAVANVVGRAELYSAVFFLAACLLYLRGRSWTGWARPVRLLALGALYFLALSAKEIAVTLPGILLLLEAREFTATKTSSERSGSFFLRVIREEGATFALLGVALAAYLGLRFFALGAIVGELPAPLFLVIGSEARILTALALWTQYLRLFLFPLDLAVDYDPGVYFPSEGLDGPVVLGAMILVGLLFLAKWSWRSHPSISLGIGWFFLAILPVSNLFFATGVLLAERTLYLPSVGLALVAAGIVCWGASLPQKRRNALLALSILGGLALFVRTVNRNPSWMSTFVVQQTLNQDHPESWRAIRARAQGLERVGALAEAQESWDLAVRLAPMNYTLLVQAGDFHGRQGRWDRCETYLRRAIEISPGYRNAYQLLAGQMIRREFGREGHRIALAGLSASRNDQELWALVSEAYILRGDLAAAARARRAAIGADPDEAYQWRRLGEVLSALGRTAEATEATAQAEVLEARTQGGEG